MSDAGQETAARIFALERALEDALAHVEQLEQAVRSRDVIGQAKGVLMERGQVDAEEAFGQLVRLSQVLNVKVREIAAHIADQPGARGET
jgi:AmiR/NasT family two-component response regulator